MDETCKQCEPFIKENMTLKAALREARDSLRIEINGHAHTQEVLKEAIEVLEMALKALTCYDEIKIESPDSSPDEEYLAFKAAGIARDFLQKHGKGE